MPSRKRSFFIIWLFILILFPIFATGCHSGKANQEAESNRNLKVYTTVYPLKDFTEKIGSPYVSVESVYPPNVDEHTYEPSQKDLLAMMDADLFFHIGFGLEGFVDKTKTIMEDEGVKVFALGEEIDLERDQKHYENRESNEHTHDFIDPHIWIDPIYAKQLAERITVHLSAMLPEHEDIFNQNFAELASQLDELHEQFISLTNEAKHDTIIVSHAAFHYWEWRYNIKQLSVAGINPSQEPSQKQLQNLIDTAKKKNIQYILVEQNVSNRLVDVVADEAGLEKMSIHNLATLTEKEIEQGEDYLSIMKTNLLTLEKILNE